VHLLGIGLDPDAEVIEPYFAVDIIDLVMVENIFHLKKTPHYRLE
jgi:hypothetical protein